MRRIYFLLVCCFAFISVNAQKNGSVSGNLMDTAINKPIAGATITVLDKKDSSLVSFTMTNNEGAFEVKGLAEGTYRLLFSPPLVFASISAVVWSY